MQYHAEVEDWLRSWKRGEERRALVSDAQISRGCEALAVMVVGHSGKLCDEDLWVLFPDQNTMNLQKKILEKSRQGFMLNRLGGGLTCV